MNALTWRRGPLGWVAFRNGPRHAVRYSIRAYRAGDGSLLYVPRVDGSALASPAPAFKSLTAAKRAADEAGRRLK